MGWVEEDWEGEEEEGSYAKFSPDTDPGAGWAPNETSPRPDPRFGGLVGIRSNGSEGESDSDRRYVPAEWGALRVGYVLDDEGAEDAEEEAEEKDVGETAEAELNRCVESPEMDVLVPGEE